jgi:hypothetical protein
MPGVPFFSTAYQLCPTLHRAGGARVAAADQRIRVGPPERLFGCIREGSKNSMPKVRGSFAGTEVPSEQPSRWHERYAGRFKSMTSSRRGSSSSKLWIVADGQGVERPARVRGAGLRQPGRTLG